MTVQVPLPGIVPFTSVIRLDSGIAVTVPPQVLTRLLGKATKTPFGTAVGKLSVNAALVRDARLGSPNVIVRVEIPPAEIEFRLKALAIVGG